MLRNRLIGYGLTGLCAYATLDACSDALMYVRAKNWVRSQSARHTNFVQLLSHGNSPGIGAPGASPTVKGEDNLGQKSASSLHFGPWYDSSVKFTHSGMVTTVQLPCRGDCMSSDITVRAVRKGGFRWTLLYNLIGGEWDVVMMDALIGMGPGGRLVSMSLLDDDTGRRDDSGHGDGASLGASSLSPQQFVH